MSASKMYFDFLNSSPTTVSAAYMRHWTESAMVQVMAFRLFGAKPLHEPMLTYFDWTLRNKRQRKSTIKFLIQKNSFENVVCQTAAILSRGDELSYGFPIRYNFVWFLLSLDKLATLKLWLWCTYPNITCFSGASVMERMSHGCGVILKDMDKRGRYPTMRNECILFFRMH